MTLTFSEKKKVGGGAQKTMIVYRIGDHPDIEKVVFNWICDRRLDAKRSVNVERTSMSRCMEWIY